MTQTRPVRLRAAVRRLCALGLLVPAAIAFSAAQARADGETITMTQDDPAPAVAGRATNFTASGTLNPDDTMFGFDIFVFLKDADADPTCAADFDSESATAMHSGGNESWVSPPGGFQVGMGPTFDQPFKITFTGHGNYLLCGYVQGDFSTFAAGELRGVVAPDPSLAPTPTPPGPMPPGPTPPGPTPPGPTPDPIAPTVKRPTLVSAPWITRKGHVLTCHAGTWSHKPASRTYRWYVKGRSRSVGSAQKLKAGRSVRGRKVVCRVTARNAAGATTVATRWVRAR
jgi:hypothetical protein